MTAIPAMNWDARAACKGEMPTPAEAVHAGHGESGFDARIVDAARHGDRAAFSRIYEQFAPMVHGILLSRGSRSDAEDLTQEVFVHAMRRLKTLNDPHAIGPWLATIARNISADSHRRTRFTSQSLATLTPRRSPIARSSTERHDAAHVLNVICSLPDTYAETLMLRLVEGLTGPQIAACTGMTPGSVRVNLHRGMTMLRDRLGLANPGLEHSGRGDES